jgi:hypothetical protein
MARSRGLGDVYKRQAPSGRARGRCGLWSLYFTSRPEEATCLRCLAVAPPQPPPDDLARKITPDGSTD